MSLTTASGSGLLIATPANGLVQVTPTGVANGTLVGGAVTFSAVTSVSVNGCFTSAFDNYRIIMQLTSSASGVITQRLRAAGTDVSAANYNQQRLDAAGTGTPTMTLSTGQTSWLSFALVTANTPITQEIYGPALAATTAMNLVAARGPASGVDILAINAGYNAATAVDGFSIICATGNMSGTIRIYGYRN